GALSRRPPPPWMNDLDLNTSSTSWYERSHGISLTAGPASGSRLVPSYERRSWRMAFCLLDLFDADGLRRAEGLDLAQGAEQVQWRLRVQHHRVPPVFVQLEQGRHDLHAVPGAGAHQRVDGHA